MNSLHLNDFEKNKNKTISDYFNLKCIKYYNNDLLNFKF